MYWQWDVRFLGPRVHDATGAAFIRRGGIRSPQHLHEPCVVSFLGPLIEKVLPRVLRTGQGAAYSCYGSVSGFTTLTSRRSRSRGAFWISDGFPLEPRSVSNPSFSRCWPSAFPLPWRSVVLALEGVWSVSATSGAQCIPRGEPPLSFGLRRPRTGAS